MISNHITFHDSSHNEEHAVIDEEMGLLQYRLIGRLGMMITKLLKKVFHVLCNSI